jgi:hypothetical protein
MNLAALFCFFQSFFMRRHCEEVFRRGNLILKVVQH